jgi:hypothetical protein
MHRVLCLFPKLFSQEGFVSFRFIVKYRTYNCMKNNYKKGDQVK